MSIEKQIIELSDEDWSGNETDDTEEFNDEEETQILDDQLKSPEIQKPKKNKKKKISPFLPPGGEFIKHSEIPDSLKNLYSNKKTKKKESKQGKAINTHLNSSLQSNFNTSSNQPGEVQITGSYSQNKFVAFNDPFNKPRSPYKCYRCGQLKKGHICAKSLANISSLPGLHSNFSNLTTKAQFTFVNPIHIMNQSSFVPSNFYSSTGAEDSPTPSPTVAMSNPILQPLTISMNTSPSSKSPVKIVSHSVFATFLFIKIF